MEQIRPFPPIELIDQAEEEEAIRLAPAVDLKEWVITNFLTIGGALHNPDHDHIAELLHDDETFLAFAWASSATVAKKRMVLGQCEKVMFNQGGWRKARQEQQMRDWFGFVPIYLIMDIQVSLEHDYENKPEDRFVMLPMNSKWIADFTEECEAFNAAMTHDHDDQVDTLIDAVEEATVMQNYHPPMAG